MRDKLNKIWRTEKENYSKEILYIKDNSLPMFHMVLEINMALIINLLVNINMVLNYMENLHGNLMIPIHGYIQANFMNKNLTEEEY